MLRVFIALGKQLPNNKVMIEDTEEVARLLAKYNCTMVQGGAKTGLMGVVVDEFQKYSDEVVMIVPEVHKNDLEGAKYKEHYIVEGESDRMKITIHTCDMMVVLPGGSGTLAELAYYNETCKSGEHYAKVVVVNTKGFYNKLFKFNKHQIKNGFMTEDACKYEVISNAKQLEPILQQLIAEKQAKLQQEEISKEIVVEEAKKVAKLKPAKASKTTAKKTVKATAPKAKAKKTVKATAPKAKAELKSKEVKDEKPVKSEVKKAVSKGNPASTKTETKKVPAKKTAAKAVAKKPAVKEETKPVEKEVKVEPKKVEKEVVKVAPKPKTTKKAEVKTPVAKKETKVVAKKPVAKKETKEVAKKEVKKPAVKQTVKADTKTKATPKKPTEKKPTKVVAKKETKEVKKPVAKKTTTKKAVAKKN